MATISHPHDYVGDSTPAKKPRPNYPLHALKAVASLRVSMVLFGLSLFLVFFGTLAQKHAGIERVLTQYFYCSMAWVDLNLISDFTEVFFRFRFLGSLEHPVRLFVPFPGGYVIGWAMVLNLTAAHIVRFKLSWRRAGIWALHAGMVVLLGGEFIRAEMAQENRISLMEGETADFMTNLHLVELVVATPPAAGVSEVVSVPGDLVAKAAPVGRRAEPGRIDLPGVPFHARVREYMINSSGPAARRADEEPQATHGLGRALAIRADKEVSGTDQSGRPDAPAAVVEFVRNDTGETLGVYLLGVLLGDEWQKVGVGGATYRVQLRMRRTPLPYTLTAEKIEHDKYPGTEIARNFASTVRLQDPRNGEDRTVKIWMNNPLRYGGMTFYQSSMQAEAGGVKQTGLQVVRNPGWRLPYISCSLVGLGMLLHFGLKFTDFLKKKAAADRRAKMATLA